MAKTASVLYRIEPNVLTRPYSYRARPVPRESLGYNELAAAIAERNRIWSQDLVKSILLAMREEIKEQLINGNQVCLENTCLWNLSLSVRLNKPDDPLPPAKDIVKVQINPSRSFVKEVRRVVKLERLPPTEKAPVITNAMDTLSKLNNVLNPEGVLRLTGTDMFFEPEEDFGQCLIAGTHSGTAVQSCFAQISNSSIFVVPDIPAQANTWNNEYKVSVSTRYSKYGNQRTGTYLRLLRSPLTVSGLGDPNPPELGILTGSASSPYVSVTGGIVSADTKLRIQAVFDARTHQLRLSLLGMTENGDLGAEIVISANGEVTLPGFSGSPVSSLHIRVNDYEALKTIVRNDYMCRLVDILNVKLES